MNQTISVVLADDHAVVRRGIREFLEADERIRVIAEAEDGDDAVRLTAQHRPAVVVMDIQMPRMTGIEATRVIKQQHPETRVLILTAYDDDPYISALLNAGADGYVLKTSDSAELVRAVHGVYHGDCVLSPGVAQRIAQRFDRTQPFAAETHIEALSPRELQVLKLASKGLTNKGIGHELGISDRTVQGHLASIYGKLAVNSRTEAVTRALQLGWITIE